MARSITADPIGLPLTQDTTLAKAKRKSAGYYIQKGFFWLLITFILLYTLFPFYWAVLSSIKSSSELFDTPVKYWPSTIDWSHYEQVFAADFFLKAVRNSIIVASSTVILSLVIGSLAAYAMGRLRFRGRSFVLYLILSMTFFPQIAILASMYQIIKNLGLYNSVFALILAYTTFTLPFTIWVLTNFFKAMPGELEEAALVDGAGPMRAFYQILLPLALPGMVTTGLLAFIGAWNEYLYAITFTQDWGSRTVPIAITSFSGNTQFELPWGNRMAASVTITVPLIALVLIFQRKIIAGLTGGAVKG